MLDPYEPFFLLILKVQFWTLSVFMMYNDRTLDLYESLVLILKVQFWRLSVFMIYNDRTPSKGHVVQEKNSLLQFLSVDLYNRNFLLVRVRLLPSP